MRTTDLFEANEPSERNVVMRDSLNYMRRCAADTGDAETFHMANELFGQYPDSHPINAVRESDFLPLDLLVRRGEFDQALATVEIIAPTRKRLLALRHVMDNLVKTSRPTRDEVLEACYR